LIHFIRHPTIIKKLLDLPQTVEYINDINYNMIYGICSMCVFNSNEACRRSMEVLLADTRIDFTRCYSTHNSQNMLESNNDSTELIPLEILKDNTDRNWVNLFAKYGRT
jgi:hypothetical protein